MVHLTSVYSPSVVCLSFGVAFLGSYLTITFCELLRRTLATPLTPKLLGKKELLGAMALSLGGIGIWCMHFIGMSSLQLRTPHDTKVTIVYDLLTTLISMMVVILLACAGLYVASLDPMFGKTKHEIIEAFMKGAGRMSLKDIMHTSHFRMIIIISTQSLGKLICGGIIAGGGVSAMHYLGMWAMRFDQGVIHWDIGIMAASILIAIVAATIAFWILFRLLSLYPHLEVLRMISAFLMAIAVTGMHFTGMMAAHFEYRKDVISTLSTGAMHASISSDDAFFGTLLAGMLFGIVLVMAAFSEHRHWMFHLSHEVKRYSESAIRIRNSDGTFEKLTIDAYLDRIDNTSQFVSVHVPAAKRKVVHPYTPETGGVDNQDEVPSLVTKFKPHSDENSEEMV